MWAIFVVNSAALPPSPHLLIKLPFSWRLIPVFPVSFCDCFWVCLFPSKLKGKLVDVLINWTHCDFGNMFVNGDVLIVVGVIFLADLTVCVRGVEFIAVLCNKECTCMIFFSWAFWILSSKLSLSKKLFSLWYFYM